MRSGIFSTVITVSAPNEPTVSVAGSVPPGGQAVDVLRFDHEWGGLFEVLGGLLAVHRLLTNVPRTHVLAWAAPRLSAAGPREGLARS